jgi:hypothetical protein
MTEYRGRCVGGPYNNRVQTHFNPVIFVTTNEPHLGNFDGTYEFDDKQNRWWWVDAGGEDFVVTEEDIVEEETF